MVKQKDAFRGSKKTISRQRKKNQSLFNSKQWMFLTIILCILAAIGHYTLRFEDLGPQLPPPPASALYRQSGAPIEARVKDLMSYMTLEEKIGQMALVDKNSLGATEDISKYYLGGVLSGAGAKPKVNKPQGWLEMVGGMKEQALKSRLGIPLLYGVDANHGHSNMLGATVFPHAIGLGASQDTELTKAVAAATSEELKATGVNWSYSPSLDAPKDMRWGRVYEAFSDSPALNGRLGQAYISGTQTGYEENNYVLASAKHYLGNGGMEWGQSNHKKFKIDQGVTPANETALTDEYLPPFKAAVDAGVASIMVGLNQWGEERVIDSEYLLTEKLKGELGFKGFVVSDWYGVYEYSRTGQYRANIKTINAGLDMAMLPYDYKSFLSDVRRAVKNGVISESRIDDAVARILHQKFKAGLFDEQPNRPGTDVVGNDKHRKLARRAVAASAVLLKNDGNVLPLSKNSDRILVAGSGANNVGRQSGAWTIEWQGVDGNWMPGGTSILQGIRQVVSSNTVIEYDQKGNFSQTLSKANVGIVVVSEKPYAEGLGDNSNPSIDEADLEAIERVRALSDRVVVIILSGRPLLITNDIQDWDGVIASWLPGSEGGGVADVLFGQQPFGGKLPMTWPANISQVPVRAGGTTNDGTEPLFERGFGL